MLTPRQHQLLRFIHGYVTRHGIAPSFDEMRDALNLRSKSGIHRLMAALEERGYIRRLPHRARALELLRPPPSCGDVDLAVDEGDNVIRGHFGRRAPIESEGVHALPFYGRIAAGTPIEAISDSQGSYEIPDGIVGPGEHYTLEVVGDSMIEAGIHDGDLVVIQRCDTAENNAIVVALIDEQEATLKRLHRKHEAIALEAANPTYETRIFPPERVRIQGRIVGLVRRYN